MSQIWYQVDSARYSVKAKIETVEVVKETEKQIVVLRRSKKWGSDQERISEDRCAKVSDWHRFFPSWQEAHNYLLDAAAKQVDSARRALEQAKAAEGNVKGMKQPKEAL